MGKKIIIIIAMLLLSGCSQQTTEPLRISVNLWTGYSPLYYLERKGLLEAAHMKLVPLVSLSENKQMYLSGFSDVFTGTQHEYKAVKQQFPTLEPLILMDRSNGGDMVMANCDLETLKNAPKINVYMEIDSVNKAVFDDFIAYHNMDRSRFELINMDPYASSNLKMFNEPTVIVTYNPYDLKVKSNGYRMVDSTKNLQLFVMDALYANAKTMKSYATELGALNRLIAKALNVLKHDPKAYFTAINPYFKFKDYDAFMEALKGIAWIYDDRSSFLLKELQDHNISTKSLLEPVHEF